jgi:ornithine cyclodeaminase/alanine dehydrogenase
MLGAHRAAFGDAAFEILCADVEPGAAARFAEESGGRAVSAEEAAGCDVVCASTPGRTIAIRAAWLRPGCHVNAMGADAPGKQELESAALTTMRVYVDDLYQATHSGEINVALEHGDFTESDIAGSIGAVIAGLARGRASDDERTLFDSTGLAIQDAALARVLLARAEARQVGSLVQLVG